MDEGQVTGNQVTRLRPAIQDEYENVEEKEKSIGWDSNPTLEKKKPSIFNDNVSGNWCS